MRFVSLLAPLLVATSALAQTEISADYLILDTDDITLPTTFTDPPALWIHKPTPKGAALVIDGGSYKSGRLMCLGDLDSTGGVDQDITTGGDNECNTIFGVNGSMQTGAYIILAGDQYYYIDQTTGRILGSRGAVTAPPSMLVVYADVMGPALVVAPGSGANSSLAYFMSRGPGKSRPLVTAVFDDDAEGNTGQEGFSLYFCDPDDLGDDGSILFDIDTVTNTITAQSGSPFANLVVADRIALRPHSLSSGEYSPGSTQALLEVTTVTSAQQITVADVANQGAATDRKTGIFRCDQRIYRNFSTGEITVDGTLSIPGQLKIPNGVDCPATCEVGEVWMDTDAAVGTNCTASYSGAVCGCHSSNSWGCP